MRIHLIAIGGAAMHNIALDLATKHIVTGSDDEIYNPSKARLEKAGLLPSEMGWHPDRITEDIDIVILGMHAKSDNPELLKAQELELKIMSYPEFIYQHSRDKKRIVISGSHGKTTTTSMILHVLKDHKLEFDYLVGAQIQGFDKMVKLSDAPIIVLEGDEYLSSALDRRPKMLHYQANIAVMTGIAWDHINVFKTFEDYKEQFKLFIDNLREKDKLYYFQRDQNIIDLIDTTKEDKFVSYQEWSDNSEELLVFGKHNLQNVQAAQLVCQDLGISKEAFAQSITSFSGAGKRLETIYQKDTNKVYLDFAHAPSKLKATLEAVRSKHPQKKLIAFYELHTYSSLNKKFLSHYQDSMNLADEAYVFFDPYTIRMKGLEDLNPAEVQEGFNNPEVTILNSKQEFIACMKRIELKETIVLLMSSGKFGGVNLRDEVQTWFNS